MSKKDKNGKSKKSKKHSEQTPPMGHHQHLNELGILSTESCVFNTCEGDGDRKKQFKKERRQHSFDSRETWSLDFTLASWLYEHLMFFKETADRSFLDYEFEIEKLLVSDMGGVSFETVSVSGIDALDTACEYLRECLTCTFTDFRRFDYERAALAIVSVLLPALRW